MPKKGAAAGKSVNPVDFFVVGSSTLDIIAKTNDVERIDIGGRHVERNSANGGMRYRPRVDTHRPLPMLNRALPDLRLVCISFASKSELQGLELSPGGSASNSAIMMRKLGSSVCLLSAVGNDAFGKIVLADLAKNGISTASVKVLGSSSTGVGLDILSPGGEKSILVYRGANSVLGPSDVPEQAIRNSRRVFIASLVSARNYKLFEKVLAIARKHRKPVVFAPSITMLHAWMPELGKLKPHFDVAIMNFEEGSYYTGKSDVRSILAALPGRVVVVTKDAEGAYAREGRNFFHVAAVPVKIADTTGAGDAFSGAFAQRYYSTGSVTEALKTAAAAAALKLTHKGAHFSLGRARLASFMKSNASRLVVRRL